MALMRYRKIPEKEDYDGAIQDYKSYIAILGAREIYCGDYQTLAEIYKKKGMKKEVLEPYSKALEIVKKEKWSKELKSIPYFTPIKNRRGLKIPRRVTAVPVQVRPWAPLISMG